MTALLQAQRYARQNAVTDAELRAYQPDSPESYVKSIGEYDVDVLVALRRTEPEGDKLPWRKTFPNFRFRGGEVTLWHGINGHGKSAVTTQVALSLAIHQAKVSCLASFEMPPRKTLERMVKQCAGTPHPTDAFASRFFMDLCGFIWIYDHKGRVDPQMLFKAIRYCAERKRVTHFFVDSLMKCVPKEDDYGAQSDFVNSLCDIAHETNIHIHLIHHTRKAEDERRPPGKFDAKGTGAITDQVDNVLGVWRNKSKEREREECLRLGTVLNDETPDFLVVCDKQRHGSWEGIWALWGDAQSWHFRPDPREGWQRGYELPERLAQEEPGANG